MSGRQVPDAVSHLSGVDATVIGQCIGIELSRYFQADGPFDVGQGQQTFDVQSIGIDLVDRGFSYVRVSFVLDFSGNHFQQVF